MWQCRRIASGVHAFVHDTIMCLRAGARYSLSNPWVWLVTGSSVYWWRRITHWERIALSSAHNLDGQTHRADPQYIDLKVKCGVSRLENQMSGLCSNTAGASVLTSMWYAYMQKPDSIAFAVFLQTVTTIRYAIFMRSSRRYGPYGTKEEKDAFVRYVTYLEQIRRQGPSRIGTGADADSEQTSLPLPRRENTEEPPIATLAKVCFIDLHFLLLSLGSMCKRWLV